MGFKHNLALVSVLVYIVIPTYEIPVSQLERVKGEVEYMLSNIDSIDANDATKSMLEFYQRLIILIQEMDEIQDNIVSNDVVSFAKENESKWTKSRKNSHSRSRRGVNEEIPNGDSKCTPDGGDCAKLMTPYCMGQCLLCPPGATGPPGPPGAAGAPGFQGPPGRDGRDKQDCKTHPTEDLDESTVSKPAAGSQFNTMKSGALFVRWGRRECPATSDKVYQGTAAGAAYNQQGSGSNYLCLPEVPIYYQPDTISDKRSHIYAAEYETLNFGSFANLHQRDVPCVVCMATQRPGLLMIPARNVCPNSTWTLEYPGYLMSARSNHYRTEYVCMDLNAVPVEGTPGNDNGALFYPVEGKCLGGLPCGPYVDGYELTCAVCTI